MKECREPQQNRDITHSFAHVDVKDVADATNIRRDSTVCRRYTKKRNGIQLLLVGVEQSDLEIDRRDW